MGFTPLIFYTLLTASLGTLWLDARVALFSTIESEIFVSRSIATTLGYDLSGSTGPD